MQKTAEKYNLENHDRVKVISKVGEIETHVQIVEGIHPQVLAIGDSCGHWEFGRIAQGKSFKSNDPNTQLLWWEEKEGGFFAEEERGKGNGVHPKPIIPNISDPIGGEQCWMDTKVRIKKV